MWGQLRISSGPPITMWAYSSTSELFRWPEWWEEHTTSERGSFSERSPVDSRFSQPLFLDVPGTATEKLRTCRFRRNSSSFYRAPKIWESVRLNFLRAFLLPSLPSLQKPGCILEPIQGQACSVIDCSCYIHVFLSKLPIIFPYSSTLPWYF